MAKKKLELEAAAARFQEAMVRARTAHASHDAVAVLAHTTAAFEHVDEMLQYAQRFGEQKVHDVAAINFVLHYAPVLLREQPLVQARDLLKSSKRVRMAFGDDPDGKVRRAFELLRLIHRLYRLIESEPGITERAAGGRTDVPRDDISTVIDEWMKIGLVDAQGAGLDRALFLTTRRGAMVSGKCPTCGTAIEAPKSFLYAEQLCERCRQPGSFVILG